MKAFISYSINDNDQSIVTLLSSKLREKRFVVNTSQSFYSRSLDFNTKNEIGDSHLFVGIITGQGVERDRVLKEWQYAQSRNIPILLLIEDTVPVHQSFKGDYVRFNRYHPQPAINQINSKMRVEDSGATGSFDEIFPWILGGAALLAILALLSNDEK